MIKYLVGVFLVLILIIAVSAPDRPVDAIEFTIVTPEYRATPHETPLSSGFNEVINAQIDNVDAIATAIAPVFDFWNSAARATPGNVVYGTEGNFGLVSVVATGTPTPGNMLWAGVVFDDYFEWYSAFEAGSYWTFNLYDAHDEPRVTCIKVIPTAGVVEFFGTPVDVVNDDTPTPFPATPTLIPTAAPPTPEIPAWGTATPLASAGDQRWNTDYQLMEQYNGSAWWPTGPLVQIDWVYYGETAGDAFVVTTLDDAYQTTYSTTSALAIYAVDASTYPAPGSGDSFTYTVSAAGTPIPGLAVTVDETNTGNVDQCTYFTCNRDTALTIAVTVSGNPARAQHVIKLYAVRRP